MRFHLNSRLLALVPFLAVLASAAAEEQDAGVRVAVVRTFQQYCLDCHAGDDAEGGINLDFLTADVKLADHIELTEKIIRVLKEQEMPPADAEQPSTTDRVQSLEWIEAKLEQFDCGSASRPGRVTMRRLNRSEYNRTIRDLTGLDLRLADDFPSDDVGNGFDNIGDVLSLPPILMEKYLASANQIANEVLGNPEARKRVFPRDPSDPENMAEVVSAARANVADFASRAFRRPISSEESDRLFSLMRSAWESDASKEEIEHTIIAAILASPHFIYRVEEDRPEDFVDGIRPLNDFEVASRLSYFLWSSMPDQQLFEAARNGRLQSAGELESQVERMLADPKAQALVDNFAGQWLQLRDLGLLSPDPKLFSDFDDALRAVDAPRNGTVVCQHHCRKPQYSRIAER